MKKKSKFAWERLENEIKEAKKNSEFTKGLKAFIDFHSGKTSD